MATSVDAYGVVCRALTYSSLAFGALNQMTLELSTPYSVNPNGAPSGACAVGGGSCAIVATADASSRAPTHASRSSSPL